MNERLKNKTKGVDFGAGGNGGMTPAEREELTALGLKVGELETQMGDVSLLLDELNS